jgi:hypothetical protein
VIRDGPNHFDIYYDRPAKPFSFEGLPATSAPIQSPQAMLELPAADDGTADERLRQIVEKMHSGLGA